MFDTFLQEMHAARMRAQLTKISIYVYQGSEPLVWMSGPYIPAADTYLTVTPEGQVDMFCEECQHRRAMKNKERDSQPAKADSSP